MELFEWMTSTTWGESLLTLLVSMVPGDRAAGRSPFGTALGLAPLHALVVCIIGNMLPIPFIIVYIRRIFHWMRRRVPQAQRSGGQAGEEGPPEGAKGNEVQIHRLVALCGHPLPGTGAWTGR